MDKIWKLSHLSAINCRKVIHSEKQSSFLAHPVYLFATRLSENTATQNLAAL